MHEPTDPDRAAVRVLGATPLVDVARTVRAELLAIGLFVRPPEVLPDLRPRSRPRGTTVARADDVDSREPCAPQQGLEVEVPSSGWAELSARRELFADAHGPALPSYAEGMSILVLGALGAGVPTGSTAVGSLSEVAQGGVNGLSVPDVSYASLTSVCLRLIEDERLNARLGAESHHLAAGPSRRGVVAPVDSEAHRRGPERVVVSQVPVPPLAVRTP